MIGKTGEISYDFANNLRDALPNASFIGFTGTPMEQNDANARAVFGEYVSVYDIQQAAGWTCFTGSSVELCHCLAALGQAV